MLITISLTVKLMININIFQIVTNVKRKLDPWSPGGCSKPFLWRSAIWSPGGAITNFFVLQVSGLSCERAFVADTCQAACSLLSQKKYIFVSCRYVIIIYNIVRYYVLRIFDETDVPLEINPVPMFALLTGIFDGT